MRNVYSPQTIQAYLPERTRTSHVVLLKLDTTHERRITTGEVYAIHRSDRVPWPKYVEHCTLINQIFQKLWYHLLNPVDCQVLPLDLK